MDKRQFGYLVLCAGIAGAFFSLGMDTSVHTQFGSVNNLGLMRDQQNYLIFSGLIAVVGLGLAVMSKRSDFENSEGGSLRPCPYCAEMIKPQAVKCRYCGGDVEPVSASQLAVTGLNDSDLRNVADFYGIYEEEGKFVFQGEAYDSLSEAVGAGRAAPVNNPGETGYISN